MAYECMCVWVWVYTKHFSGGGGGFNIVYKILHGMEKFV